MAYNYNLLEWIDIDKIDWEWLSRNPEAIHMLEANPAKIDWTNLSRNPNAIAIQWLEATPDNINWTSLSLNPAMFKSYHETNECVLK